MKRLEISALIVVAALLAGCSSWNLRDAKSPVPKDDEKAESGAKLVSDFADPFGMFPVKLEAVGLVTGLHGTGSDPEPSAQRSMLLEEMQRRGVKNPSALLASRNVSLVLVRAILRPGIQKGDVVDVEVRIPGRSETTSLRGGYLLETRLSDMGVFDGRLLDGKVRAIAQGPVLVDPSASATDDKVLTGRGRVLGGGVVLQPRSLGLEMRTGDVHLNDTTQMAKAVSNTAKVAKAINRQLHTFRNGMKTGVATAKTDKYIDLMIHPRYKDNVDRYMQVIRSVAIRESAAEQSQRAAELEVRLLEPSTSAKAALELEAIGKPGIDVLLKGVKSSNREVRFYAAESLAYLDRPEAAEPLGEAAHNEPAFRVFALTALAAMEDYNAADVLRKLLVVPSAETRYGAFRALWKMNPSDSLVKGEQLGKQFSYHVLDVPGAAMVHATRNRRAEIVLFGQTQRFLTPLSVNAGNQIMVNSNGGDSVCVSKFSASEADQKRTVSARVDDVIRAIVELGGTYPDVVQALQEAKSAHALEGRFEVEALPEAGRVYHRDSDAQSSEESGKADAAAASDEKDPKESGAKDAKKSDAKSKSDAAAADGADSDKKEQPRKGFLAKIVGRRAD